MAEKLFTVQTENMNRKHKHTVSLKSVSDHEIKNGISLVKYLLRNENDPKIKVRLADLGEMLNRLSHNKYVHKLQCSTWIKC